VTRKRLTTKRPTLDMAPAWRISPRVEANRRDPTERETPEPMKQWLKRTLYSVAPDRATSFFSARSRAHSHRVIAEWGCRRVNDLLLARHGNRVLTGPFQGLVLSPMTKAEQLGPYLLGLYENELHPIWDMVLRGRFDQIIDVGAKFGYYAIALARRYPSSRVVAFDTDPWARRALWEMCQCNDVQNVEVQGYCSAEWLADNLGRGSLIISDCEGFEGELFCSRPILNLESATLIIESHDSMVPDVTSRLTERLAPTHYLTSVPMNSEPRTPPVEVDLRVFTEREQFLAIQEVRPTQMWLVGIPIPTFPR
jgi:hypothetical protein